ncbi:MAG TPA: tRNA (adenosine(37)-N6)-threonylcarbamoyltransferase complex dimerization subunit type 1 TsaB [Planctomycetota bacterium]|nr:tRNA (adenosine(37)-N6)-threonylcarbamoyltransferase complex dimerization subunit type 1 TsaB [Planctomycetota bacterium]
MRVLGIESSGTRGGVALLEEERVLGVRLFEKGMVHGREIAPAIRALLEEAGLPPAAIDLVACDVGPGSYTGLRVGLAAAKGLALALGRPVIGVPSLDALADAALGHARLVVPALDAKWDQIYGALYEEGRRVTDYLAEKPAVFAARVPPGAFVLGDALDAYGALFRDAVRAPRDLWDPRPERIALLGRRRYAAGLRHDAATLAPLYLRPTEAELKAREKLGGQDERGKGNGR